MRHFFVEKVKAIVSNVDYEKATMHVENIDVPYFDTLDKWGDFVKELNVANRADRISGTDLALEMNGGKTAHINKLDIDLDYINDGGEHELPDGELEVSFHLASKGSIYYLRELWFGDKPVYVTYRATAENIDIDIDIDETEEYDRYDEFFESVYREARGVSIDDDGNGYYDSGVDWINPMEIKNGQFKLPKWVEESIRKSLQNYPDIDVSNFIKRLTDPNGLVNDYINIREEKASEESIKEAIKHYLQELVQLIEVAIAPSRKDSSQENDSLVCTLENMATKYKIAIDDINKSLR